jgi:hypothetical protein
VLAKESKNPPKIAHNLGQSDLCNGLSDRGFDREPLEINRSCIIRAPYFEAEIAAGFLDFFALGLFSESDCLIRIRIKLKATLPPWDDPYRELPH